MRQAHDISIDINNVIIVLVLIGVPLWVWGAWAKRRYLDNVRVQWIMRTGFILSIVALVWIMVDLLTGRLVTIR